ncbi:ABC transporter ATP-binding protein [Clostridiaceae bacterium 35-E11]
MVSTLQIDGKYKVKDIANHSKIHENTNGSNKCYDKEKLLEVEKLTVSFVQYEAGLRQQEIKVIHDLNLTVDSGEIMVVVGASGSGKSLLAHAILDILPQNARVSGAIRYLGEELTPKRQALLRGHEIALIPQSVNYLDPLMRVGDQVRSRIRKKNSREIQRKIFERYHLRQEHERLFPFQLSGGMARRVLVSTAVVGGPKLIIADEPTPGLHPQVVEETLKHLRELADEGCGIMMITHDIDTALKIADKIAVFYAGTTIEIAPVGDFTGEGSLLRHPYTKALWRALPQNEFIPIPGFQPAPRDLPRGCVFEPRCQVKTEACSLRAPEMRGLRDGKVRCYHAT